MILQGEVEEMCFFIEFVERVRKFVEIELYEVNDCVNEFVVQVIFLQVQKRKLEGDVQVMQVGYVF